jgi:hypothetical protein
MFVQRCIALLLMAVAAIFFTVSGAFTILFLKNLGIVKLRLDGDLFAILAWIIIPFIIGFGFAKWGVKFFKDEL